MTVAGGICMQCALREFVEMLERGLDPMEQPATQSGLFEGDPMEHMAKFHPNPVETQRERTDLERRASTGFEKLIARKQALAKNARNN